MHRTLGTHWFLHAEMAALQPHNGVVQKLFAFRAQAVGVMMVTAINPHHRGHRPPFAGEARLHHIVLRLHEIILAERVATHFDINQGDCEIYFCGGVV